MVAATGPALVTFKPRRRDGTAALAGRPIERKQPTTNRPVLNALLYDASPLVNASKSWSYILVNAGTALLAASARISNPRAAPHFRFSQAAGRRCRSRAKRLSSITRSL